MEQFPPSGFPQAILTMRVNVSKEQFPWNAPVHRESSTKKVPRSSFHGVDISKEEFPRNGPIYGVDVSKEEFPRNGPVHRIVSIKW
jgi:hypothetical protein